jgi:hypothetical protein
MAIGQDDGRDDEINALMNAEGVDSAKIAEQVAKKSGKKKDVTEQTPVTPPVTATTTIPPLTTTPPMVTPIKENVPDPETIKAGMLHEMWGDQFKTVEDFKKANIPAQLQELATLRQKNQELETQLKAKPKHHYANDDIAKYDEFVRETGIKDARVFDRLNGTDLTNMEAMDALILYHIVKNPALANKEPQVRKYFETKYNVDSKKVESGDLTQEELDANLIGVISEGEEARTKLQELKSKIKMPEIPKEEIPAGNTKWTPEIEAKQKADWSMVNSEMYKEFSKLPVYLKGVKEPIVNFELPEEAKSKVLGRAIDYIISNQLEVNTENVKSVAQAMYSDIRESYFDDIVHAVFERARSMTEKEYLETYHNPSKKNDDIPAGGGEELSDEAKLKRAYEAELTR